MAEAKLELIETTVTDAHVRMRYADKTDLATQWLDFRLPLNALKNPWDDANPLGNPETKIVAEVRLAALRALRELIGGEIQRLSDRSNYRRG